MKSHTSYSEALGGPALQRAAMAIVLLLAAALLAPRAMAQSIFLDPNNPLANFVKDGNQGMTPGAIMLLVDSSGTDHVGFYGATSAAAAGRDVDVTASFRVQTNDQASGVDSGMRLVIADGAVTSFIAGCVTLAGIRGVAIAIGTNYAGAENWAGFVPVDWQSPVTLTIRRYANFGGGEIVEVNGVLTTPGSTLIPAASLPGSVTEVASVGFGLFADVAFTIIEMNQFSAVAVTAVPEPETYALLLAGLGLLGFAARRRKLKEAATA